MKTLNQQESIIVVGDYCRKDFLGFFSKLKDQFSIYFLEYSYPGELRDHSYQKYGTAIFWKDFISAQHLLKKIRPRAVIFFFIESLNHVAILNACKVAAVKTYHLEHGLRDLDFQLYLKEKGIPFNSIPLQRKVPLGVRLRTRLFFEMTRLLLPGKNRKFLSFYKKIRLKNSILDAFLQIKNEMRTADHYISFSPAVYKFHQRLDGLSKNHLVTFIGLPPFDYIVNDPARKPELDKPKIVFIDSAFHVEESYGWTKTSRRDFLNRLKNAVESAGFHLWIKKHPLDYSDFWRDGEWSMIGDDEWSASWSNFNIILGEYSTLMIPLAALSHTVCFCFDAHPVEGYKVSNFLTEGGVCDEMEDADQLGALLKEPHLLCEIYKRQWLCKDQFLKNWLTALDGSATERFTELIRTNVKKAS